MNIYWLFSFSLIFIFQKSFTQFIFNFLIIWFSKKIKKFKKNAKLDFQIFRIFSRKWVFFSKFHLKFSSIFYNFKIFKKLIFVKKKPTSSIFAWTLAPPPCFFSFSSLSTSTWARFSRWSPIDFSASARISARKTKPSAKLASVSASTHRSPIRSSSAVSKGRSRGWRATRTSQIPDFWRSSENGVIK